MPTADDILAELRAHRRDITAIFAARDDDENAAKKHEADAKRFDAAAASARLEAKKAREEDDSEDAARHDATASTARASASAARKQAKAWYDASAKELAASDSEAATKHGTDAKRMQDEEDAAASVHAAAEAEAKRMDEDAAATRTSATPGIFPTLLRSMTRDGRNWESLEDAENLALLHHTFNAMTYPSGTTSSGKRRKQEAAHDDTAEDTALFRRLIKQYKNDGDLPAPGVPGLRVERKLRSLEAALGGMHELLTDVVHSLKDLATDKPDKGRGLSTDTNRQQSGGPVRRTMSATGTDQFRSKFDDQDDGKGQKTQAEIDAALDEQALDPVQRMAAKLVLGWNGQVKQ